MTRKNNNEAISQPIDRARYLISLHWDYENVADSRLAQDLVRFCQLRGELQIQKVYANRWNRPSNARTTFENLGFCLVSVLLKCKNSADYKCMFDCIEAAQGGAPPDIFIFVAGDGGYAHVIRLLKSWGKRVIIFARRGSDSRLLKRLAHEFYFVDELPVLVAGGSNHA
ncbi:hypothetical protein C7B76_20840 [filamentous cyanobacterium CCP2]|nr:hypothetical protein C7B76_20840 [filamentous cyanobacterium CCP2]